MRGKLENGVTFDGVQRITPAHAGKTTAALSPSAFWSDHPRACGENTSEMAYFRG